MTILVAEDDDHEFELMKVAFEEARLLHALVRVRDGVEALKYLRKEKPDGAVVVLLDLNMPRKDGRETLQEIKGDPVLRRVPVIVLTNSSREEDVIRSYDLGANAFVRKPLKFADFLQVVLAFKLFWLNIVDLPPRGQT